MHIGQTELQFQIRVFPFHFSSLSSSPASSWTASQGSQYSQQTSSQGSGKYMNRDEFLSRMSTLRSMFPSESREKLEEALSVTGDVEQAIDYVINAVNTGERNVNELQ